MPELLEESERALLSLFAPDEASYSVAPAPPEKNP
jgi:hypothetical protein